MVNEEAFSVSEDKCSFNLKNNSKKENAIMKKLICFILTAALLVSSVMSFGCNEAEPPFNDSSEATDTDNFVNSENNSESDTEVIPSESETESQTETKPESETSKYNFEILETWEVDKVSNPTAPAPVYIDSIAPPQPITLSFLDFLELLYTRDVSKYSGDNDILKEKYTQIVEELSKTKYVPVIGAAVNKNGLADRGVGISNQVAISPLVEFEDIGITYSVIFDDGTRMAITFFVYYDKCLEVNKGKLGNIIKYLNYRLGELSVSVSDSWEQVLVYKNCDIFNRTTDVLFYSTEDRQRLKFQGEYPYYLTVTINGNHSFNDIYDYLRRLDIYYIDLTKTRQ